MNSDATPNADSIAYWNEDAGPRWVRNADKIDIQLQPFLEPLADAASVGVNTRVLDVGCGAGALSLHVARRVGPDGSVTGVDLSAGLLELARRRAVERCLSHVEFCQADAQVEPFGNGKFDSVVSRFGVMFFESSEAAFRNLRNALRPGGRLAFTCWAARQQNPWMTVPREVVARYIELPEPSDSSEPGPFRLADSDAIRALCEDAGFADVEARALEETLTLGGGGALDDAVEFFLSVGPAAQAREQPETVLAAVRGDLRNALRPYAGPKGVEMSSCAWLVSATRP